MTLFDMSDFQPKPAAPPEWSNHGGGEKMSACWVHTSGWWIQHCGHPTALWPYALMPPDGGPGVVAFNGRGFKTLRAARAVVHGIVSGRLHVSGNRVVNADAFGLTLTVHRCLAITDAGPWCDNMTEPGRSYCSFHLVERGVERG